MKRDLGVQLLTRRVAVTGVLLLLILPLQAASAHSADMYLQDQSLVLAGSELRVDWHITPGPLLARTLWNAADQDNDGAVSSDEAETWARSTLPRWTVTVDGQPLGEAQLKSIIWPKTLDALEAGDEPVEMQFTISWPDPLAGKHHLEVHNGFDEPISLNWFSLQSEAGVSFAEPEQADGSLQTDVYFQSAPSAASALTAWESGRPNLPGLSDPLSKLAASPTTVLTSLVRTQTITPVFLLAAFLLSLALGALHALTPGHGKTLVAAYLVGSQGRIRDAVFLGTVVTVTHTGSVLLLGLITLVASRYILPAIFIPVLELLSGLFVAGFGVHLLIRRSRALYAWYVSQRAQQQNAWHRAVASPVVQAVLHVHENAPHMHHDHPHTHPHSHDLPLLDPPQHVHSHSEHTHALPSHQVTWQSLLALGVSGGLVPCPDAIAILLVAVAVNRIPLGLLLIVAFSLGLAMVLIVIGIAMVNGMQFISRNDFVNRFSVYTPTLSALAVLVLGIGLTVTAVSSAFFSPAGQGAVSQGLAPATMPTLAPVHRAVPAQGFDLKKARVLYLAWIDDQQTQLYVRPLAGGDATQITREPSGIEDFALSPDEKKLLYKSRPTPGGSLLWSVNVDGTQRRQVLDCPRSDCGGPVWLPNESYVMYERIDFAQRLLFPSIWRLDLQSGDTRPIFQDRQLPSLAPRFSADGRWLSYISPSSQTLQVYDLGGDRNLSLPYRSGMPAVWSPVGDAFLYWDQTAAGKPHLNVYDVATNRGTDLSGAEEEGDYSAAWSPDGQWIAMTRVRQTAGAGVSTFQERVWLVRPDGTQARQLFGQDGMFYEDLQWSPDGRYLIYTWATTTGITEIRLADVQQGQETLIVAGGSQPVLLP
jgi:ABC-type nickel/cobalt efflux system permease component RcnA/Tol biopolymer transport system component